MSGFQQSQQQGIGMSAPTGFRRLVPGNRRTIRFSIDGKPVQALAGDSVLTALRINAAPARTSEFGDGPRAGFCLMGACQDCWVTLKDGRRLRACETPVEDGMNIITALPSETQWPGA